MKTFARVALFLSGAIAVFAVMAAEPFPSTYQVPASPPVLIQGATVLTGTGERLDNADVLIADGRITAVGRKGAVNAPAGRGRHGDLAGNYGGVGANASVGVGFGGNFLVGGPENSYALQPISVQGQTGLNVAAGVADIELEPVQFAHGGYRRHTHRHRHHG